MRLAAGLRWIAAVVLFSWVASPSGAFVTAVVTAGAVSAATAPSAAGTGAASRPGARVAIVATHVWSRPATDTAVVYASLSNEGVANDELIGVSSQDARAVEIHRTSTASAMNGVEHSGGMMPMNLAPSTSGAAPSDRAMSMKRVSAISLAAGKRITLAPGGYHVMLIGLRRAWRAGARFTVAFIFRHAGVVRATGSIVSS